MSNSISHSFFEHFLCYACGVFSCHFVSRQSFSKRICCLAVLIAASHCRIHILFNSDHVKRFLNTLKITAITNQIGIGFGFWLEFRTLFEDKLFSIPSMQSTRSSDRFTNPPLVPEQPSGETVHTDSSALTNSEMFSKYASNLVSKELLDVISFQTLNVMILLQECLMLSP